MDLNKLFVDWNLILVLIGFCSVISIAIFIERLMQLKKAEVNTSSFIIQSKKFIEKGSIVDAVRFCDDIGGAIGHIVKAGLVRHNQSQERIENAMEITGLVEISKLEKNAKILSVIAYIAPLIGLLGTVLGFIQAFSEMRASGLMDISTTRIGEAMEFALVTTAAGLVVAIPTVIAYNYIVSRIESIVLEIQTTSSEIVDLIVHHGNEF
jgi:biopolymer transport protein ExbB